jgi:hypothetical protein
MLGLHAGFVTHEATNSGARTKGKLPYASCRAAIRAPPTFPRGLEGYFASAHLSTGMAAVLKRLLTLCLALAVLVGVTALLPCSLSEADMSIRSDMAAGGAGPEAPCAGHVPTCTAHFGCLPGPAIPTSRAAITVALQWTTLAFNLATAPLSGLIIEPELSPPIPTTT